MGLRQRHIKALAVCAVVAWGCTDARKPIRPVTEFEVKKEIGPEGGTITGPNGVKLEVPAGALDKEIELIIRSSDSDEYPNYPGSDAPDQVIAFLPHGTQFLKPVKITMPHGASNINEAELYYAANGNAPWTESDAENIKFSEKTVSAEIEHFCFMTGESPNDAIGGEKEDSGVNPDDSTSQNPTTSSGSSSSGQTDTTETDTDSSDGDASADSSDSQSSDTSNSTGSDSTGQTDTGGSSSSSGQSTVTDSTTVTDTTVTDSTELPDASADASTDQTTEPPDAADTTLPTTDADGGDGGGVDPTDVTQPDATGIVDTSDESTTVDTTAPDASDDTTTDVTLGDAGDAGDGGDAGEDTDASDVDAGDAGDAGPIFPIDGGPVLPDGGPVLPDGGPVLPDGGPVLPDGGPVLPDGGPIDTTDVDAGDADVDASDDSDSTDIDGGDTTTVILGDAGDAGDGGEDAGAGDTDAGVDAGDTDAGVDAGAGDTDAGVDAGPDAAPDAAADAGDDPVVLFWDQTVWNGDIAALGFVGDVTEVSGEYCVAGNAVGTVGFTYNVNQLQGGAPANYTPTIFDAAIISTISLVGAVGGTAEARLNVGSADYCVTWEDAGNFDGYGSYQGCGGGAVGAYNGVTPFDSIEVTIVANGAFELCASAVDVFRGP